MKKDNVPDIKHTPEPTGNAKKGIQAAQNGTGVPPVDFSSTADEDKADGPKGDVQNARIDPVGPASPLRGGVRAPCTFGHPASARDGHLRNSGHASAHRIGSRKK